MPVELQGRAIIENDTYFIENISLFDEHIAYIIARPANMTSLNYARFAPVDFKYQYSANGCDWVIVEANKQVILENFEINTLVIGNEAGAGNLRIYLEGRE